MPKVLSVNGIKVGLSEPSKALDDSGWILSKLDISAKAYTSLGEEIAAYAHLRYVLAGDNELEDVGQLGSLKNLIALDLSRNVLTNEALNPETLAFPNLQVVDISNNKLVAPAFSGQSAPKLLSADFSANGLTSLEGFDGHAALEKLRAAENADLTTTAGVGSIASLTELHLSGCGLTELAGLDGLPALARLDVSKNKIASFAALKAPEGDEGAAAVLPQLKSLVADENEIESLEEVGILAGLNSLESLDLRGNPVADTDNWRVEALLLLPGLQVLDGEQVTVDEIREMKELRSQREEEARIAAEEAAAAAAAAAEEEEGDE